MRGTMTAIGFLACAAALGCSGKKGQAGSTSVLALSTTGPAAARAIRGVELTITLPAGVTIAADASGTPADGVVVPSGSAAGGPVVVAGHYAAATPSAPGTLTLVLVKTTGFDPGEFAAVAYGTAGGAAPGAADFRLSAFKAVDQSGAALAGLEATAGAR